MIDKGNFRPTLKIAREMRLNFIKVTRTENDFQESLKFS
jgi:hypothetical protein